MTTITFKEALKILNIEDYGKKIFNSNSMGELYHVIDYIDLATHVYKYKIINFREIFIKIVENANKTWKRPLSIFQHILKILENDYYLDVDNNKNNIFMLKH